MMISPVMNSLVSTNAPVKQPGDRAARPCAVVLPVGSASCQRCYVTTDATKQADASIA